MQQKFPITIGIISICLLLILACTPSGQMSKEAPSAVGEAVPKREETIKIGLIAPFSGSFGSSGQSVYTAIKFAVKEQNAKGGLLGKKIDIIREDSKLKLDLAIRKAKKLVLEKRVNLIFIGPGSHIALEFNRFAKQYKTIFINLAAPNDTFQGREFSRYTFRVFPNFYTTISAHSQFMATTPYRKYYIICPDYIGGHDLARAFKTYIKQYIPDAQIVGEDYHILDARNFGRYIKNVKAAYAEIIFSGTWGAGATELVGQARSLGLEAPFPIVIPYWSESQFRDLKKEDAAGVYSAVPYTMLVDTPENKAMIAKYHKQHRFDKPHRRYPYDWIGARILGTQMVFAAVEKAGSLDPDKIIEAFEGFRYKTPVGWWHMRKCDHQVLLPMFGTTFEAKNVVRFSAEETAIPATSDYNPRCP